MLLFYITSQFFFFLSMFYMIFSFNIPLLSFMGLCEFLINCFGPATAECVDMMYISASENFNRDSWFGFMTLAKAGFFAFIASITPSISTYLGDTYILYLLYVSWQFFSYIMGALCCTMGIEGFYLSLLVILHQFSHRISVALRDVSRTMLHMTDTSAKRDTKKEKILFFLESIRYRKAISLFANTLGSFLLYTITDDLVNLQRTHHLNYDFININKMKIYSFGLFFILLMCFSYWYKNKAKLDELQIKEHRSWGGILEEVNKFKKIPVYAFRFLLFIIPYSLYSGIEKNFFYIKYMDTLKAEEAISRTRIDWVAINGFKAIVKSVGTMISIIVMLIEYSGLIETIDIFVIGTLIQIIGSMGCAMGYGGYSNGFLIAYVGQAIFDTLTINSILGVVNITSQAQKKYREICYQAYIVVVYTCLALGHTVFNSTVGIFPMSEYILPMCNLLGIFILIYYHRSGMLLSSINNQIEELKDCSWDKIIWGKEYKSVKNEYEFYTLDLDSNDKLETTISPTKTIKELNKFKGKGEYFSDDYIEVKEKDTPYLKQKEEAQELVDSELIILEPSVNNESIIETNQHSNVDTVDLNIILDEKDIGTEPEFELEPGLKQFNEEELVKSIEDNNDEKSI